jgi:hypothetical protein
MPEIPNYTFSHTELAEILIKRLDLHDGLWGVYFEFSFLASNVPVPPDGKSVLPASLSFVQKVGLQRFPAANNLTVDAAKVNPSMPTKKKNS